MACPRIDHSLFQKIRTEHEKIIQALELWPSLEADQKKQDMGRWLWGYVELRHHAQEERLLFQAIYNRPKIKEGGPLCTLYFDFHMVDNPMVRAESLTKRVPALEPHQQIFYDVNSPVRIPLEEHRGGKEVLRHLLSKWAELSEEKKATCMQTYKDIQMQHIAKEESCFFHLCLRLFSIEELDLLSARWIPAGG